MEPDGRLGEDTILRATCTCGATVVVLAAPPGQFNDTDANVTSHPHLNINAPIFILIKNQETDSNDIDGSTDNLGHQKTTEAVGRTPDPLRGKFPQPFRQ